MVVEEGCVCGGGGGGGAGTKHVNTISVFNKLGNKQGFPSVLSSAAGDHPGVNLCFSPLCCNTGKQTELLKLLPDML